MIRNIILALAVICGLGGTALALAGLTAHSAVACDDNASSSSNSFKGT